MQKTIISATFTILSGLFVLLGCASDAYAYNYNISLPGKLTLKSQGERGEVLAAGKNHSYQMGYHEKTTETLIGNPQDSGMDINYQGQDLGVWNTNIKGIGVAYAVSGPYNSSPHCNFLHSSSCEFGDVSVQNFEGRIILVRTGDVGFGTVNIEGINVIQEGFTNDNFHANNVEIAAPTCQIETKSKTVNVPMGNDISLSTFKRVGSRSTPVSFGVSMRCPAGINKLYYRLDQTGGSEIVGDPKNGTISLSNQGGASGVGVQISNGSPESPMPIGQNTQVTQYNPDQDNQPIRIDFNARYIQTGSQVTGGKADAQAIFTMSYE
ncbi:fimbrial protein [Burkholderia latens]|uniref:fimbrial protein n=1 Tax=Burkholderia latens TaxID=488446 RepID=UPI001FC853EE|nr:fimbrial protein [Burkholderia latens]